MLRRLLLLAFALRPSTVHELLRRRLEAVIPLNKLLGIEIMSIGDGIAEARLPFRTEVTNHIGSMHATAIFGLAEAASGGAMLGTFAPLITTIRPVAANANVTFLKIVRTDLFARAVTMGSAQELRAELANTGKIKFNVAVKVIDSEGTNVAEMTVAWHVAKK